ncbi:ATP-binding protein [uncultured Williamsia sp.]|uniref:sensor histidine kinase n=1 Tax=uncultured Williamsia sp. TaxID=259311 RepID=UPI002621443E|nr:ATP-binding protein [uncultured Williamsia sp.]
MVAAAPVDDARPAADQITDPPSPVRGTAGDAERRITRQFAIFVGAGYLAYLVISIPSIGASFAFMRSWWAISAPIAVFGSGLAIGVAGIVGSQRWIRWTTQIAAVAFLVAVLLTPVGWTGVHTSIASGLWYATFMGLVAVALGLQPGIRPLVYLAVVATAVVVCNTPVKEVGVRVAPLPDLAFAFAYSMPYVCATVIGVRTARVLDQTRAATYRVAAETAAAQARTAERARFDALTHDGVMATLLGASRMGATDDVRALARRTLDDLAEIAVPSTPDETVSAATAARRLRAALTDLDDGVHADIRIASETADVAYPAVAVQTITAATGEAVRNSLRHARATTRGVGARLTADSIDITVVDDGRGFTPRDVAPHRLGIAVSIVGRMRQIDGGDAVVDSTPGRGTRVTITWRR